MFLETEVDLCEYFNEIFPIVVVIFLLDNLQLPAVVVSVYFLNHLRHIITHSPSEVIVALVHRKPDGLGVIHIIIIVLHCLVLYLLLYSFIVKKHTVTLIFSSDIATAILMGMFIFSD